MNERALRELMAEVAGGGSVEDALDRLRSLPFEDVGSARVDLHRELRTGAPEVIYGASKTPGQIQEIARALLDAGQSVLVTRTDAAGAAAVEALDEGAIFDELSRTVRVVRDTPAPLGDVAVVCAGTSDLPVAEEAAVTLEFLGATPHRVHDVGVAGLHRVLAVREELSDAEVVIVCAGMDGALPSVVGGLVGRPVIAVPTSVGYGAAFGGVSALLAMLNACAAGIVVVNIDNGFGAARAAQRILRAKRD